MIHEGWYNTTGYKGEAGNQTYELMYSVVNFNPQGLRPHRKLVSLATTKNMVAPPFFQTCPEQISGLRIQLISWPTLDRYEYTILDHRMCLDLGKYLVEHGRQKPEVKLVILCNARSLCPLSTMPLAQPFQMEWDKFHSAFSILSRNLMEAHKDRQYR